MIAIAIKSFKFYLLSLLTSMTNPLVLRLKRAVRQHAALFIKKEKYLNHLDIAIALDYAKGTSITDISNQFSLHKRSVYRRIRKAKIHTGCFSKSSLKDYLQKWMVI
ncbi:MAG TPA: hypothetical protein PLT92_13565 [Ignavibacteriaceae bacterium]|nr:hypothetical protein [Ignavibacteriaceae bacterium]